jgi:hypothetical protein
MAPGIILSAWTFMNQTWRENSVTEMHCPQSINILVTARTGNGYNQIKLTEQGVQNIFPAPCEKTRINNKNAATGW